MSSTADFKLAVDAFRARADAMIVQAPQKIALALWELLVDATPVLSGLTRANWTYSENAPDLTAPVTLSHEEYRQRQKEDDPLPRPDPPTPGVPQAGTVYYIVNATVDPKGHQYLFHILDGTPSQLRPWFAMSLEEVKFRAPELIRADAFSTRPIVDGKPT